MGNSPERRLANRLVELHDIAPPVDIVSLAKIFAEVEFVAWPHNCDGLTTGLTSPGRPKIFIRDTGQRWRERFTVAHELGHVVLPWHVEEIACTPEVETGTSFRGGLREWEASTFASHILVPDRFLQPMCMAKVDVVATLDALELAEVSVTASLISLVGALPPGFAFVFENNRIFRSRGTVLPAQTFNFLNRSAWMAAASDTGRARFRTKSLRWFVFERLEYPAEVADPRETTVLRDAIAAITDDPEEQRRLLSVVNGVIGAAMTHDNRASPVRALATMRHRMRAKTELLELLEQPDFDLFLRRRARLYRADPG